MCVPLRSYGKGTEIVIPITQTKLWERERNQEFSFKKLPASAGNYFLRIASESEKVFARILDEFFRCFDLPEISVFSGQIIRNFKTLTPPLYFEIENHFILFQKSVLDGESQQ